LYGRETRGKAVGGGGAEEEEGVSSEETWALLGLVVGTLPPLFLNPKPYAVPNPCCSEPSTLNPKP